MKRKPKNEVVQPLPELRGNLAADGSLVFVRPTVESHEGVMVNPAWEAATHRVEFWNFNDRVKRI